MKPKEGLRRTLIGGWVCRRGKVLLSGWSERLWAWSMGGDYCRELLLLAGGEGAAGVILGPGPVAGAASPLCFQPESAPRATASGSPAGVPASALPGLGCAGDACPPALRLPAAGRGAMELSMKKFTVRRFFSVYLRKKSRSKSSSLSRLEVKVLPGSAQDAGVRRASGGHACGHRSPSHTPVHLHSRPERGVVQLSLKPFKSAPIIGTS